MNDNDDFESDDYPQILVILATLFTLATLPGALIWSLGISRILNIDEQYIQDHMAQWLIFNTTVSLLIYKHIYILIFL